MKNGFTQIEALVCLLVILVIIGFVVPSVTNKIQENNYYTCTKKAMFILQDALDMLVVRGNNFDFYEAGHNSKDIRNAFGSVLTYMKVGTASQLFPNGAKYRYYKSLATVTLPDYASAILNNGYLIRFDNTTNGCTSMFPANGTGLRDVCSNVLFDINGTKGPNMFGKDLYYFYVIKKGNRYAVYPMGSNNDGNSCVAGSSTYATSKGCVLYRILGGKMP